ncbi:DNA adenine methylase [Microbacterium sp. MYb66]|uniref:DNA adenine methylase n=1 Tax=Microbacterium sp. MYb66 TaxID=1848692 RepID=UPI001C611403|nr:DNA adenine methylase [Microbacterium sp. MYb66]
MTSFEPPMLDLFGDEAQEQYEDPEFLSRQLITYLGNKRALGKHLARAVGTVRERLGGRPLRTVDLFSGTGYVARFLKQHSSRVIANDLELYSYEVNRCFLTNREDAPLDELAAVIDRLNRDADGGASHPGFFAELYSPADDQDIQPGERAFYTNENARRLDFFSQEVAELPEHLRHLVLGPLLSRASMHANTSGVFKGFYKDKHTGIGKFGGAAGDALKRILEPIRLEMPTLSRFSTATEVMQSDANAAVEALDEQDLVYLDPPYNQHPYGSNYFMLNLVARYEAPAEVSAVSGIPTDWNRSGFNVRKRSFPLLADIVATAPARFLLVSFNAEGYVATEELRGEMERHGTVEEVVIPYNTFRGSRNLRDRDVHVNEHLFLLDRG